MAFDVSQYLLKTGPIRLADLFTRYPELAWDLSEFRTLAESGEIEVDGDRVALQGLNDALEVAKQETVENPGAFREHLQRSFSDTPGAGDLRIRLSESSFKKALRA